MNKLSVIAVSAPQFVARGTIKKSFSFNSGTPFSLQNALRDAVDKAIKKQGAWGNSNFSDEKKRNKCVLLLEYWENDRAYFEQLLNEVKPNLLFIGSMTLSFPGAVIIAKTARKILKNNVCIVLGGKHVNESFFLQHDEVVNLQSSALRLMNESVLPNIFDIVISGDGEKIITRIGEVVCQLYKRGLPGREIFRYKSYLEEAEGDWMIGQVSGSSISYIHSKKLNSINYETLPIATTQYYLTEGFNVFDTDFTAHAYSDISKGCPYNCFFCSEKSYINGKLRIKDYTPALRLFKQFKAIDLLAKTKYKGKTISLFVEDSIFLGARIEYMKILYTLLKRSSFIIPFGVQFTLDTFLYDKNLILVQKLTNFGLKYVAFGVETQNEEIANSFSKNSKKDRGWLAKTEEAVLICKKLKINVGMFLLFGLGETQNDRIELLTKIQFWKFDLGINIEVGLNIATQHPLRDQTNPFRYTDWGTSLNSPYLEYFVEMFGEASEKYKICHKNFPEISELQELRELFLSITKTNLTHA